MSTFRLPDLGEGLQEAEVVTWMVGEGDRVVADQPLVAVETDKAVVEVPSPLSGTVARLLAAPGDIVGVGQPLVEFNTGEEKADTGTVVGRLEEKPMRSRPPAPARDSATAGARVAASPAVRSRARELDIDLSGIAPTGPGGAVTMSDVDQAASAAMIKEGWEPVRGVRRAMAKNMAASHAEIASATVSEDADVHGWSADENVMYRLIRAMAAGAKAEPALNAWYDPKSNSRRLHDSVNLGIAVDTEQGLFAPVLTDIGNRTRVDLLKGLDSLKGDVAKRTIPHEHLVGQTISLSNFGSIGGRYAQLVIVAPQVAIVGAGRVRPDVVATPTGPQIRRILPLSLTFDHRVITGGEATRFLMAVMKDLQRAD